MAQSKIVDQYGRPIQYDKLTEELAAARTTRVRQVWHQSVANGLTPGSENSFSQWICLNITGATLQCT
ncbi:hypothetical protein, partial [Klebsiella variicola]|uniref:hypothetical protein n=1 Tax=Klebsiella variicola TaxID=244366 RepID=UPI0027305183